jgi:D-sedoheptulose 7-phosphate isomerase
VLRALVQARRQRLTTIALVGSQVEDVGTLADITISVPADSTARVQEVHRTTLHVICELIEDRLSSAATNSS